MLGGVGAETVDQTVGNAVVVFADNPDQWQKLGDDPGKIPAAFEELLRMKGRRSTRSDHHPQCHVHGARFRRTIPSC